VALVGKRVSTRPGLLIWDALMIVIVLISIIVLVLALLFLWPPVLTILMIGAHPVFLGILAIFVLAMVVVLLRAQRTRR